MRSRMLACHTHSRTIAQAHITSHRLLTSQRQRRPRFLSLWVELVLRGAALGTALWAPQFVELLLNSLVKLRDRYVLEIAPQLEPLQQLQDLIQGILLPLHVLGDFPLLCHLVKAQHLYLVALKLIFETLANIIQKLLWSLLFGSHNFFKIHRLLSEASQIGWRRLKLSASKYRLLLGALGLAYEAGGSSTRTGAILVLISIFRLKVLLKICSCSSRKSIAGHRQLVRHSHLPHPPFSSHPAISRAHLAPPLRTSANLLVLRLLQQFLRVIDNATIAAGSLTAWFHWVTELIIFYLILINIISWLILFVPENQKDWETFTFVGFYYEFDQFLQSFWVSIIIEGGCFRFLCLKIIGYTK